MTFSTSNRLARQLFLLLVVVATLLVGCSSDKPAESGDASAEPAGWTDQDVTFDSDGLTIYGSYRHDESTSPAPAALLISESGNTDRNGDNNVAGPIGNMRKLAELLSDRGVASLRYDKIGTGKTGIGSYESHPADVVSAVYTAGAQTAVRFLADQPATDKEKISVYGVGEGAVHAMNLAAAGDPRIHSLALLQPLPMRYLDIITSKLKYTVESDVRDGRQTQADGDGLLTTWAAAVKQIREQGTVPPNLPPGLAAIVGPANVKAVAQADAVDPVALAATVPAGTPVLLTCSDSDTQASCDDMQPLIDALSKTDLQVVRFTGVSHVLKDDPTDAVANYAADVPLTDQLVKALDTFATK